jgi:hypothetical protein
MTKETPTPFPWSPGEMTYTSMTLRDYFAAQAMQALIDEDTFSNEVAAQAYALADAMLKARGK